MTRLTRPAALVALALTVPMVLSGCYYTPVGSDARSSEFGVANRANFAAQDAYNLSNQRLRDMAKDFAANTQDTVTFAFDRSSLDQSARTALDSQVAWLKANPEVRMTIIGHTDLVGSNRYNDGLGLRRARAVLRYLTRRGISRKRLDAVASRGEREPVVQTEQRERRNRRAMTTVAGFSRNYVGTGLDGEYAARVFDQYQAGAFAVTDADTDAIN
ncbi:MAG: OmpA family protein [Pseudomonadota bacterium]